MVRFGICASTMNSLAVKQAGWDYVEENAQGLFKGTEPDEKYEGRQRVAASALPVSAANSLVPGSIKITGPTTSMNALQAYMTAVLRRAGEAGCRTLVFGSGAARHVPDGWDKSTATDQIVTFGKMIAPLAKAVGVTIVLEHLCRAECNIVNTLEEELSIVQRVGHPHFMALLDTYHLWIDELPMASVLPLMPFVRHVHMADKDGRVVPGESGKSDYRPVFALLKKAGYAGGMSVEALNFSNIPEQAPRALAFLKRQWDEA
jgi:sugar phosphate isomerase/epimerase